MKICYFLRLHFCIVFVLLTGSYATATEDYILAEKKGVIHKFVSVDAATDHFTRDVFQSWRNETFEVFDKVKDDQSIAIDIGAGIGTTGIWLSKKFHHVIAVEADNLSLKNLQKNLEASDCSNVSICDKPILGKTLDVIFGPKADVLNDSRSYIKQVSDNENDYIKKSITFKQMINDYVYANDDISSQKISFIKCDIEEGEENILEDILHFAYNNNCKVYMSFHLNLWKSKKIRDFNYLFKYFKTSCPSSNICKYITQNPTTSILFEPKMDAGILIKKNIPAVIIGYNQLTFIRNMVKQLEKYTSDIIVIDNDSTFKPLLNYYENDFKYTLLKQKSNFGYSVYKRDSIQKLVGDLYVLTDPDLQFNLNLPDDFIQDLIKISNHFKASRVGFALFIDSDDIRTDITFSGESIKSWESRFWKERLFYPKNPDMELYSAAIDTTFCLINRKFHNSSIRVAGNYTCFHIPWHKDFQKHLDEGEYESYLENNTSTNWFQSK